MEVCIVNTVGRLKNGKGWQIMRRAGSGYNHVFPGVLYTMEEAVNVGDFWQCLEKQTCTKNS